MAEGARTELLKGLQHHVDRRMDWQNKEVDDIDAFTRELPEAAWADGLKKAISNLEAARGNRETIRVLVVRRSGRIVGGAVYEPPMPPGEAHLHFVAVSDEARGVGIARSLFDAAREAMIRDVRELGWETLAITAWPESPEGEAFLRRLGFEEDDEFWQLEVPLKVTPETDPQ